MRRTARDFDAFVAKNVTTEWEAQKHRIFEHFGLAPKSTPAAGGDGRAMGTSAFGASSFGRSRLTGPAAQGNGLPTNTVWAKANFGQSVLGKSMAIKPVEASSTTYQGSLFSDVDSSMQVELSKQTQQRQQRFSGAVKQLNETRLRQDPSQGSFPLMKTFADITAASGKDMLTLQLEDSWKLLASVVGEADSSDVFGGAQERQFMKDYILNPDPDSLEASRIRKRIEKGSRRWLEKQFHQVVEKTVVEFPTLARVGGIPSVLNKFRGFINVKMSQNHDKSDWDTKGFEYINEVPCWAMVFYLIRAGLLKEADAYVSQNQSQFQKLDRGFATYLHAYCAHEDRRLPRQLHDRIQGEYNNRVRHMEDTKDPFKPAVYKILGRCELAKRSLPSVMPTAEDWMWLQLVLSREIDRTSEPAHEVFTLLDLQKSVTQFGAKHFMAKGSNFGLYFQMLLMCGLFEDAIHYLYSFQYVDGVHFAIALTYYGLLRPSDNPLKNDQELITLGAAGEKQLNFPRLIGYYTSDFRTPNAEEAVDYLTLISLNGDLPGDRGAQQLKICHEALRELVLSTREFTALLGDVHADGSRQKGAIEKRMKLIRLSDQSEYLRTITEQAAVSADDDGRAADAVLLYHLAEDYDTVVQILNKNLSNHIALDEGVLRGSPMPASLAQPGDSLAAVDDPVQLARNMLGMYHNNTAVLRKIQLRNREACGVLLQIADAKEAFAAGDFEGCLAVSFLCFFVLIPVFGCLWNSGSLVPLEISLT